MLGLQVLASPLDNTPNDPTVPRCFESQEVKQVECADALSKIIYDKDILNKLEKRVSAASGSCLIKIYIQNQAVVTKQQITDTVSKILAACKSGHVHIKDNEGVDVVVSQRLGTQSPYYPDFPLEKPFCFPDSKVSKQDCLEAYNQFPVDGQGQLINPDTKSLAYQFHLRVNSCRINIYTTDGTNVLVKKQDALAIVNNMINTCDSQEGAVIIKGAEGPNGRVTIMTGK
ncbi:hypothetical protein PGT21_023172 [Puccinia graminis f. sp. tritici]|uniref:Uncharacterized protein n=1 Tax=Puccinia graminis f. sp. tritici TaxID=56615 RepID=A0A5B0QU20_PUCGR|nr:hypothetical protein PGT21_023172 [Puccinia graminis f. sp. tritici]